VSYARWAAEALVITIAFNWSHLEGMLSVIQCLPNTFFKSDRIRVNVIDNGYNPDNFGMDMWMLFVIGIAWRILAYIALIGPKSIWKSFKKMLKHKQ
jgi:hypothetical protein